MFYLIHVEIGEMLDRVGTRHRDVYGQLSHLAGPLRTDSARIGPEPSAATKGERSRVGRDPEPRKRRRSSRSVALAAARGRRFCELFFPVFGLSNDSYSRTIL